MMTNEGSIGERAPSGASLPFPRSEASGILKEIASAISPLGSYTLTDKGVERPEDGRERFLTAQEARERAAAAAYCCSGKIYPGDYPYHGVVTESASEPSGERIAVRERASEASLAIQKKPWYPALADFNIYRREKPGWGIKKVDCGKWIYTGKDENGNVKLVNHSCGCITCSLDYTDYLVKKADEIDERFKGYIRDVADMKRDPRQFIFSISPERVLELIKQCNQNPGPAGADAEFLDLYRVEFNEMLAASGLAGGVSFYHDCRVRHPGTGATGARAKMLIGREAKLAGFMADDAPKSKIYEWIAKQENRAEYYPLSPHSHVVAFGKILDIDAFREACPNWIYKNKGTVKNVAGLVYYLMSHQAVIPEKRSVTAFGCMSSARLGRELVSEKLEDVLSPDGLPYFIVDAVDPSLIGKKITRIVKLWFYKVLIRGKPDEDPGAVFDRMVRRDVRRMVVRPVPVPVDVDDLEPESPVTRSLWITTYEARNRVLVDVHERPGWKEECELARLGRLAMGLT